MFRLKACEDFPANFPISIIAPEQVRIFKEFILMSNAFPFKRFFFLIKLCFICKSLALMILGGNCGNKK